jgi:hypothetical protein
MTLMTVCVHMWTQRWMPQSGSSNTHSVPMEPVDSRKRQVKMFSSKPLQGGCCDMRCDNDAHYPSLSSYTLVWMKHLATQRKIILLYLIKGLLGCSKVCSFDKLRLIASDFQFSLAWELWMFWSLSLIIPKHAPMFFNYFWVPTNATKTVAQRIRQQQCSRWWSLLGFFVHGWGGHLPQSRYNSNSMFKTRVLKNLRRFITFPVNIPILGYGSPSHDGHAFWAGRQRCK